MMVSLLAFIIAINLASSEQDDPPTNPFGFYCVSGKGDYEGIDASWFEEESNTFYPENGINQRPVKSSSISSSNVYDTYNADECRRVRRPWNSMTMEERSLYRDGLLKLRENGELNMNLDELVGIASVHDNLFGSVTHHDSDYLFWHGYLVWELESRIRNLGGKFKCFGMPYWDFTDEYDRLHSKTNQYDNTPNIYKTGLGGFGDPDDYYKVNEYSWNVKTNQYWSPLKDDNCLATNDECPICSLKRDGVSNNGDDADEFEDIASAEGNGAEILKNNRFTDFQQWMVTNCGLPHGIDNSYDPIWYLFHSMESYYQAMWVNCNDYDLIQSEDLKDHPEAFEPYCIQVNPVGEGHDQCVAINLDDPLYFSGLLPKRPWSFIHNEQLTIRKLYNLPQWNVIYDLNGDEFFTKSGLAKFCKNKLNEEWFILPTEENEDKKQQNLMPVVLFKGMSYDVLKVGIITFVVFGLLVMVYAFSKNRDKVSKIKDINIEFDSCYGAV